MKWINIYLTKEQRKQCDEIKVKYKLSLTTIVDILCEQINQALFLNADKDIELKFKQTHLYPLKNKTSIHRPKCLDKIENIKDIRFVNNCINAYLRKELGLYIKADILTMKNGTFNQIEHELQTRKDDWWEYHRYILMRSRYERNKQ